MGDEQAPKGGGQPPPAKPPKPPELPKTAPKEIVAFVDCKAASVELKPGKAKWLPKIAGDFALEPDISFEPGADASSVKINVSLGLSTSISATVDDAGQLSVDSSSSSVLSEFKDGINDWVNSLNAWLKSKNKKLAKPKLKDGVLTLDKENIAAGGGGAGPPGKGGVKDRVGSPRSDGAWPLPYVPIGEKIGAVALFAVASVGAIVGLPSDHVTTKTETRLVIAPAPALVPTPNEHPTPVRVPPVIGDACIAFSHVPGQYTDIDFNFTSYPNEAGPWRAAFVLSPTLTPGISESGTGSLDNNGHGQIVIRVTTFGPRFQLKLWAGTEPVAPGPFAALVNPLLVTPAPGTCDVTSMHVPARPATVNPPVQVFPNKPAAPAPPTKITQLVQTTEHGGPPYSLLLIPGSAFVLAGALLLDDKRRGDTNEADDQPPADASASDDLPLPPWPDDPFDRIDPPPPVDDPFPPPLPDQIDDPLPPPLPDETVDPFDRIDPLPPFPLDDPTRD